MLLLAALGASPSSAQFLVPEGSDYHNGSTLPLEGGAEARRSLNQLREGLALGDADAVMTVVRDLRASPATDLVPFGPRTHVPVLDRALHLALLDPTGVVAQRIEAEAGQRVDLARRDRDLDALLEAAAGPLSLTATRVGALAAARLYFERGEWWAAEALAGRAGDLTGAAALARAAAERRPGEGGDPVLDPRRLEWRFSFESWHSWSSDSWPLVTEGRDDELLILRGIGLFGVSRGDPVVDTGPTGRSRRADLGDGRMGWVETTLTDRPWPLPSLRIGLRAAGLPQPRRMALARRGDRLVVPLNVIPGNEPEPRAHHPRDAHLAAVDLDAVDLAGGAEEVAWVLRGDEEPWASATNSSSAFGPPLVRGGRVFALLFRSGLTTEVSLVCASLETGERLFETPLVRGAAVERFASRQATSDWWNLDKRAREAAVAEQDGILYACTGFGAVAAVDAFTGRPRFTFLYDRLFPLDPDTYDHAYLVDTGGWDHEPVRVWDDRIVVAPSDSRYLYVLSRELGVAGHVILDDPIERMWRRHVVGLLPDPWERASPSILLTELRNGVFRLVLIGPDGRQLAASPALPPGERVDVTGTLRQPLPTRPLLTGGLDGHVFVPTSAGVRAYSVLDLAADPVLLSRPAASEPVVAVHAVRGGLIALSPTGMRQMKVECWEQRP